MNRRARKALEKLGDKPTVSIPTACGGWDETRGAYRLFAHPEVSARQVLALHYQTSQQRMGKYPRVLCVQDTTELDYSAKGDIQGLGLLNGSACNAVAILCSRSKLHVPCKSRVVGNDVPYTLYPERAE